MLTGSVNFCIFNRDGFHHVVQAALELLISGYPSASASQSARITVVNVYVVLCHYDFGLLIPDD